MKIQKVVFKKKSYHFINDSWSFILLNKGFFLTSILLFGVYIQWWLAFSPGILTEDSLDQWKEATTFRFKNASPFMYAFIMAHLRIFHDSPAPMALLQVVLFIVIVALFINYAWKKGVSPLVLVATVLFFVLWPQFGVYNVTIWKDVMYSICSLSLGLAVFVYILKSRIENQETRLLFCLIAFLSALMGLFRFNGLAFLFFPSIIFFIMKILNLKKALQLFLATILVYLVFGFGLAHLLRVQKVPGMTEGLMVKNVGAIYSLEKPNLNEFEKSSFEAMDSEKDWKQYYTCLTVNPQVFHIMKEKGTNPYSDRLDPNISADENFRKAFFSASIKNPAAFIKDRACLASNLLGILSVNGFLHGVKDGVVSPRQAIVTEDSKNIWAQDFLKNYLRATSQNKFYADIFWSTWPVLVLIFAFLVIAAYKKLVGLAVYICFVFLNLFITLLLVPAMDYRYVYFVYVCAPFVLSLYLIERNKKQKKGISNSPKGKNKIKI